MKITKTFDNASLRTVNEGYIELDYNGKTHCFNNASVISVNNGNISIEVDWKLERGELIKITGHCTDSYSIFDKLEGDIMRIFGYKRITGVGNRLGNDFWALGSYIEISSVTPEEQQAFDDFCKSQGKIWNKEKLQWENYRWKPIQGEWYYCVDTSQSNSVVTHRWVNDSIDNHYYDSHNCFQTHEKAELVAKQVEKLLKSL